MDVPALGRLLHTADTSLPCPQCGTQGPLEIYETAARWPCGHIRALPPLGPRPKNPYGAKRRDH